WDLHYAHLAEYVDAQGHCKVPQAFVATDGSRLGVWATSQNIKHCAGLLSLEKVERLKNIGFQFASTNDDDVWLVKFNFLKAFHAKHGTCRMERKYVTEEGVKLGWWIKKQRQEHKKGTLSADRTAELERLGLHWTGPEKGNWEVHFDALRDLMQKFRETHLPTDPLPV
ncbi:helicase associated domain-containing protein, partial [Pelagophyceae sp. CCMP2097]